eukprot:5866666-Amphidinium_carterae.2
MKFHFNSTHFCKPEVLFALTTGIKGKKYQTVQSRENMKLQTGDEKRGTWTTMNYVCRLATLENESAMHSEEVGRWAVSYSMLARRLDNAKQRA